MKFIVSKFIILIFLFLLPKYNNQCPTSSTPSSSEECTEQSTDDTACCYVEYSSGTICEELEITKSYRFILGFLSPSPFDSKENGVSFSCGVEPKTCGTDNPKELFQCREHSSTSESCCKININGDTNCILADTKFETETTNTILGAEIVCIANFLKGNLFFLGIWVFLFF